MRSLPHIHSRLSATEEQFDRFVDCHAGRHPFFEAEGITSLPGDTVRTSSTVDATADDVLERHHALEFLELGSDGHWRTIGAIDHVTKEVQTMQGRFVQIESSFQIDGPGIPGGRFSYREVEPRVHASLETLRAARPCR